MPTTPSNLTPKGIGTRTIRVLIVDDSPLIRNILTNMLEGQPDIKIVGQAADGQEAVRMTMRLNPDVITMDIRMPRMDGMEATRHIMRVKPTPIVVVANGVYDADSNIAFSAIEAGALTVIEKPRGLGTQDYDAMRNELASTLRMMSEVKVVTRNEGLRMDGIGPRTALLHAFFERAIQAIAIGSSTGGPAVLKHILGGLPKDFSIPILIVQHVLPAFVQGLADWLNESSPLTVKVAHDGEALAPGKVLISPGDVHMTVLPGRVIKLDYSEPLRGQRPSATRLFESMAAAFGPDAVGLILTGMGEDGVDGLEVLSRRGAHVIAQDEATSIVYGMPKAAVDRGVVDEVLSPEDMVTRLLKLHRHNQSLAAGK